MKRGYVCALGLALCSAMMLTGCMKKMTVEEMKEGMPPRPPELDRLDAFTGTWESEGTCDFAFLDQTLKATGTNETHWEADKMFLVSHGTFTMEGLGDMTGLETWTYDSHSDKYRSTWTDSMGSIGMGESTYDEDSGIWKMKASSYGPWGKSHMSGTVRFTDNDHMEWSWTEHMGLMKTTEMSGTAHRVK